MYGMKALIEVIENETESNIQDDEVLAEIKNKKIELEIERQKMSDQRVAFNKLIRERSRQEELNDIIVNTIKEGNLIPLEYSPTPIINSDNSLLISLNDIHYGAGVDNYWRTYNPDICRSMFWKYLDNILNIANTHKSSDCYVWANGDLISGFIKYSIAVTNQENIINQVIGVSELISEFLAELSKHFNMVHFVSVAGNHSRLCPNKEYSLKDERLDDLVGWYLKARLQNFKNILVNNCNRIDDTMYTINVRGKTYCGIHGDYDGSKLKVQTIQAMVGEPVYAILSGHLHHNQTDEVQGIKTIMAGSFLGMDDFCVEKRIVGKPQQLVCVCDSNGVRCMYDIEL